MNVLANGYWIRTQVFVRICLVEGILKVALQTLGRKFYKNTKNSSLYSQSLSILIHKAPVVKNHMTTGGIIELLRPRSTPTGITVYFLHEQLAHLNTCTGNTQKKVLNVSSDKEIMENNYVFVMLWNLSVISPLIFLQCFFFYFWRKI